MFRRFSRLPIKIPPIILKSKKIGNSRKDIREINADDPNDKRYGDGQEEGEGGGTGGQVVAHRSRNADEGFYCIERDIKVQVTSVHSRNRPELVTSAHRASTGLILLLLSHSSRPNGRIRRLFFSRSTKSTLETSRSS